MSEQKSFFSTLPGILTGIAALITAVTGLIFALYQTGLIGSRGKEETKPATVESKTPVAEAPKTVAPPPKQQVVVTPQPKAVAPKQQVVVSPKELVPAAPETSKEQTTDGWAIIGHYEQGKFSDLVLMVRGDSPAIGRSYDAVKDFRLVQKRPEKGQAVITLGMVHRGDSVEVLDIEIEPSSRKVPVYAKLRAALHPIGEASR